MKTYTLFTAILLLKLCGVSLVCAEETLPSESTIRIMTFNIWHNGKAGKQPLSQTAKVIQMAKADIVGLQEANATTVKALADMLGQGWHHSGSILSRYRIVEKQGKGIKVRLNTGHEAYVFNNHFAHAPYQPYQLLSIPYHKGKFIKTEKEAIAEAIKARGHQVAALLKEINAISDKDLPVFVTGDFNEPSHQDWTAKTVAMGRHPAKVSYPTTRSLTEAGFVDAYRLIHQDEVKFPGYTWTTTTKITDPKDHHDRIDFVFYKGKSVKVESAQIVGENQKNADIVVSAYPSDHRAVVATFTIDNTATAEETDTRVDAKRIPGYRGIWFDLGQRSEFGSKYSGGLGTYTAKHQPLAVYVPEVQKTFFVYGGNTEKDKRHLLAMASYYDHQSKSVPMPVVVHDKQGVDDPHDNPCIQVDEMGHLWVYVSGRGHKRPGHIYRSRNPYDINSFEHVSEREFTYPQPWSIEKQGFLFLFTKYTGGRELYWSTSDISGKHWSKDRKLAGMGGHYQISNERNGRVITAFNMHPGGNPDKRTNLYFLQTDDYGKTWKTAGGEVVNLPLTDPKCSALLHDYRSENRLVYMKDIGFDTKGNPVILYLTSGSHQPGPVGAPRSWTVAHWADSKWIFSTVTTSTHNYDMGSLYLEADGTWRIIAPTEKGPQEFGAGGEIAIWSSRDQGKTWKKTRTVTQNSPQNHGYVRRPKNAHSDFYGFWADGNPDRISESHLYFTNKSGEKAWRLPYNMDGAFAVPKVVNDEE